MVDILLVGAGGALGAAGRYGISLLPVSGEFPLLTLCTNFLGALLIGFVAGLAERGRMSPGWTLFWKTGVCGGFTTFSTFSLESLVLFRRRLFLPGGLYVLLSVSLCLAGVLARQWLAGRLVRG